MATLSYPYDISNGTDADAQEVMQNFQAAREFVNDQVIHADGSVAMSAPLLLPGDPVSSNQAARKQYVDLWLPAGTVVMYWGVSAPSGWVWCDGATYAQATYPRTAAALGVVSGSFAVPNLNGRVPVGVAGSGYATALGNSGGSADAVLVSHSHGGSTNAADVGHSHSVSGSAASDGAHSHSVGGGGKTFVTAYGGPAGLNLSGGSQTFDVTAGVDNGGAHTHTVSGTAGAVSLNHGHGIVAEGVSASNANLPPFIALRFMIRMS